MHSKKAIIIGSGIGGMATAIRLALQGFQVVVYEKNEGPGGKLSAFEIDGFRFDAGPSLFTQPRLIEELFELADEPIQNYFKYEPVDVACRYTFPGGKVVNAYTDTQLFASELQEKLGESPEAVQNYLNQSAEVYNCIGSIFLNHSLHKRSTWINKRSSKALRVVKRGHLFSTLHEFNSRHFKSPEAVQLFDRYATYNGSNPYKAPGMLSLIPHLEQNLGTFYPKGGMISITNALFKLAQKKGVQFNFNTPVQRIIHHEANVRGVVVNDQNIAADVVVSNADVYFTYRNLLNSPQQAKQVLKQERSSSAVIFYWGINKLFPKLHLHNIFFSNNYQEEFDAIFNKGTLSFNPTIYINITAKMEPLQCPAGTENWFVMVNAPANTGQDWTMLKEKLRGIVIAKLSSLLGEDVAALIVAEQILDPVLIESQTTSFQGSLYGTSSNSKLAAFLRHPNFTSAINGLYFCGGSVHPGGGIPLCLSSAKIVSELIGSDKRPTH